MSKRLYEEYAERFYSEAVNKDLVDKGVNIGEFTDEFKEIYLKDKNKPKKEPLVDFIVEEVRDDLKQRSEVGIKKYGVTLDRRDLKLNDWLQHAYEEALDHALYLKRAMKEKEGN